MTPFDHFVRDLTAWLDTSWYLWAGMAAATLVVVLCIALAKARARVRRRIPQYRRHAPTR
ncbi:MAG: hypothetical protein ABL886_05610 [Rhodoglobus sp.]